MAFFEMHCFSHALNIEVAVNVIIPDAPKSEKRVGPRYDSYKTLYLLHGLSDDHTIWMRRTAIERYAIEHGIAVVMPAGNRSWYSDTAYGAKYFTFVAEELPAICRSYFKGMSAKREDNMVAGLSMGGYGAFKIGMTYPDRFFACASLSGAFDVLHLGKYRLDEWRGNWGFDLNEPDDMKGSPSDLFSLTEKVVKGENTLPKLFLWCGTDDSLIKVNREYKALLEGLGVEYLYTESEGDHTWKWWDMHIQNALNYMLDSKEDIKK
ncbi:MAG: esterase family protein [Clostridia bacterium]|nr:esterase family protein [Clostridia bacterium]